MATRPEDRGRFDVIMLGAGWRRGVWRPGADGVSFLPGIVVVFLPIRMSRGGNSRPSPLGICHLGHVERSGSLHCPDAKRVVLVAWDIHGGHRGDGHDPGRSSFSTAAGRTRVAKESRRIGAAYSAADCGTRQRGRGITERSEGTRTRAWRAGFERSSFSSGGGYGTGRDCICQRTGKDYLPQQNGGTHVRLFASRSDWPATFPIDAGTIPRSAS